MLFTTACLLSLGLCISIGKVHTLDDYDYEDAERHKSCSMTESISGGNVTYTNGGAVGSVVKYDCGVGFKPYPVSKKVCNSKGEWEPKVSRIKCEEDLDYGDYEEPQKSCPVAEMIKGGNVSYSQGGLEGSVLMYHCEDGHYPYPVRRRVCNSNGQWSVMVLPNGKRVSTATCKEVLCPAQLQFDNGEFWPRKQWFKIGEEQSFSCMEGFKLLGSARRNCTKWGQWTGTTPVCDDQMEDCKNPGTPPGAMRSGDHFRIGDKVKYRCQSGLDLLGSEVRECLNVREWSGPVPRCQAQYTFDLPATVAEAMGGSLSAVMDFSSPEFRKKDPSYARAFRVAEGRLNVFILLDTSRSISEEQFNKAKKATAILIQKLSSYEVQMKIDIISYAGEPKDIIKNWDPSSHRVDDVVKKLMEFDPKKHGDKTGTNLFKALYEVYNRLNWLKHQKDNHFNETQNVILIETDGYSNMGGNPQLVLTRIRELLNYELDATDNTGEELLDVYVFGIGEDVKRSELKSIASSKTREQHLFLLSSYTDLGEVFNNMINDTAVTKCGVAKEHVYPKADEHFDDSEVHQAVNTRPWHVSITWNTKPCQGSILTENWVITAAHCLIKLNKEDMEVAIPKDVRLKYGNGEVRASSLIIHPQFNVRGLKDKNINEFYDYDVALITLSSKIKFTSDARPICLPCTKASNRALKLSPESTCEKHKNSLLDRTETQAYFIRQGQSRKQTHIQTNKTRADCIKQYKLSSTQVSLTDVVTDRFLCTGGSKSYQDEITCKGDSGGALFLSKGVRYFQVGVVSWGNRAVCDTTTKRVPEAPADARDFHISVFSIMPWLKQHLNKELDFLPH